MTATSSVRRTRRVASVVLLVLALGVVGQACLWWEDRDTERSAAAALDTGAASVSRLLSYSAESPATMDAAGAGIAEVTTGEFGGRFGRLFTDSVRPAALAQRARTTATVMARAEVSATADTVVALFFVNQTTQSTKIPGERIDTLEARVTMRLIDGRWLVAGMDQV